MKRTIGIALACLLAVCASAQSWKTEKTVQKSKGFIDDFARAKVEAAALSQPILALFTGSDWCPWCVKLHDEVFDKSEFKAFAADNLVLFIADFPRGKKLSDDLQKQNRALAETYGVRGFPTVLLLGADGKVLAQTGYQEGGAAAYVASLKELLTKAGVKVTEKSAGQTLSLYEKMKAKKAADAK